MALFVLKFGGTSVANVTRLEHAAKIIQSEVNAGHQIIVVTSAMAGFTNQLISYTHALCPDKITSEHDTVASSGEQITIGLMALALQKLGLKSQSFLSWQIPILTDSTPCTAKIAHIPINVLEHFLKNGIIPVVAGFQGLSLEGRITTLGRGGSDTTAVALAAAIKADRCDIYTDVDGVYTADPRLVPKAKKIPRVTYAEMFELAAQGAKVLQARSVELAMKYKVPLRVLSSFVEGDGTHIVQSNHSLESTIINGIAHSDQEAKIIVHNLTDKIDTMAAIFGALADESIPVDMIVQGDSNNLTFTIQKADLERAVACLSSIKEKIGYTELTLDTDIAKVSVIGVGIRNNVTIASRIFKILAYKNIPIHLISTSEIKISIVTPKEHMVQAICALHTEFELDEKAA